MMARATPLLEQTPWIRMYGKYIMSCTKNPQNVRLLTIKKRISPKKDKLNFHLFYKGGVWERGGGCKKSNKVTGNIKKFQAK